MKKTVKVCFLVFCLFTTMISCSSSYDELTEEIVRDFITEIDNAIVNMDVDGVADALSDDAIIVMNINMQGQTHVIKPSKHAYIEMLEQGWSAATNYEYTRTNLKIVMQDNKAIVTALVRESMTVQGRNMDTRTREKITVELINGQPLITNVVGHSSL